MSLPKLFLWASLALFSTIIVISFFKQKEETITYSEEAPTPVPIVITPLPNEEEVVAEFPKEVTEEFTRAKENVRMEVPEANRIEDFFRTSGKKLPIVETVVYKSRVPWLQGRSAWVSDYAAHHKTSRHFIARSLNKKPEYNRQNVANGNRFNVLRQDKDFDFYLLVDLSLQKMWFYYIDNDTHTRHLLKTYPVGVGRKDENSPSGFLTPIGRYLLGESIAIYRPKMLAFHHGKKTEMVRIFGTRWIPFKECLGPCSEDPDGFGIHGLPLKPGDDGVYREDLSALSRYESDGCVRMATEAMEELFAIIITRPTTIEIVNNFHQAELHKSTSEGDR